MPSLSCAVPSLSPLVIRLTLHLGFHIGLCTNVRPFPVSVDSYCAQCVMTGVAMQ